MIDNDVNLLRCLLWQHDNAEALKHLIRAKQDWYDENHVEFWRNWFRDVFDLRTANEFGLAVWARILGVRMDIGVGASSGSKFGFGTNHQNFNNGGFGRAVPGSISMTIEQRRIVLRARYLQLVSRGTVPEINMGLKLLVGHLGPSWVVDHGNMSTTVYFQFPEDSQLRLILEHYKLIPVPTGVKVYYLFAPRDGFGFGPVKQNFDRGSFVE